jgi:transcriptional regulator with PAS, ATPase and Fis domain
LAGGGWLSERPADSDDIRELQNVIERAVIIADSETLSIDERWLPRRQPPSTLGSTIRATSIDKRRFRSL